MHNILHNKFGIIEIDDKLTIVFDGAIPVWVRIKTKMAGVTFVSLFAFIASDGTVGRCEKPTILFIFRIIISVIISLAIKVICASIKA